MWALVTAAWAGCSQTMVDRAVTTVRTEVIDSQGALGTAAFSAACADTTVGKAAAELASVAPDRRSMLEMKAVAESPALWMAVCGGPEGLRVLADLAALPKGEGRAHLWRRCELSAWVSEEEWLGAKGGVVLPFLAASQLAEDGVKPEQARPIVRAMLGLR